MSDNEIIELRLTKQEAHVVLRALAGGDAGEGDRRCRTWIAERLLRHLSPDLGPQPLAAVLARAADIGRVSSAEADGEGAG